MMSCASCGETIPPAESDLPCPRCGSADRNLAMADYGAATDEITGLDARFPPPPPPGRRCGQRCAKTSASCAAGIPAVRA
jgi:hypothetical protein